MFPEPMFPGAYVPRYLCFPVPMFPGFCTLIGVFFFTNVGPDQSKNISYNGNKTHQTYLTQNNSDEMKCSDVSEDIVLNIINKLPNKNSCGYDNLSTKTIKELKCSLVQPLTLIINQIINPGVFPAQLKIAKVIPIFKKKMTNKCLTIIDRFHFTGFI